MCSSHLFTITVGLSTSYHQIPPWRCIVLMAIHNIKQYQGVNNVHTIRIYMHKDVYNIQCLMNAMLNSTHEAYVTRSMDQSLSDTHSPAHFGRLLSLTSLTTTKTRSRERRGQAPYKHIIFLKLASEVYVQIMCTQNLPWQPSMNNSLYVCMNHLRQKLKAVQSDQRQHTWVEYSTSHLTEYGIILYCIRCRPPNCTIREYCISSAKGDAKNYTSRVEKPLAHIVVYWARPAPLPWNWLSSNYY